MNLLLIALWATAILLNSHYFLTNTCLSLAGPLAIAYTANTAIDTISEASTPDTVHTVEQEQLTSSIFSEIPFPVPQKSLWERTMWFARHGSLYQSDLGTFVQLSKDKKSECEGMFGQHDVEGGVGFACSAFVVDYFWGELWKGVEKWGSQGTNERVYGDVNFVLWQDNS